MIRLSLLFTFSLSLLVSAFAQDEPAAPTLKEAKAAFDKANKKLNEVWASLKAELTADEFTALQEEQRGWLEYRQGSAEAMSDAKTDTADFLSMAADLTNERTAFLKGLIDESFDEENISGVWSDSYGGTLEIVQKDDGSLCFSLDVVRGPTMHLGQLAGVGVWNHPIGWFSDEGMDGSREDITNLSFILRGKKLEITGANTHYYHGAHGYFDGQYVKTADLSDDDVARVIKTAEDGGEEQ